MNRRQFSKNVGLGALGAAALGVGGKVASLAAASETARTAKAKVSRAANSEKKEWAHEYLKGLDTFLFASSTPDMKGLDEAGVRLDIQHSLKQGFTALTNLASLSATREQNARVDEIIKEETRGNVRFTEAQKRRLVGFPSKATPKTEDDVYNTFREIADSSEDAIVLYAIPAESLYQFHSTGIPLNVYSRLADHPNVVGVKLTHSMSTALAFEICERVSDRLIVGPVNLDLVPVLAKNYKNIQWSGIWSADAVQSPEKPYGVEFMDLIAKGKFNEAMKVYWTMEPLVSGFYELQGRLLLKTGLHPWAHIKYFQWLTGGNGGLIPLRPEPNLPSLDAAGRALIRENFKKAGITTVNAPEEEYIVGKVAYAKGDRATGRRS